MVYHIMHSFNCTGEKVTQMSDKTNRATDSGVWDLSLSDKDILCVPRASEEKIYYYQITRI